MRSVRVHTPVDHVRPFLILEDRPDDFWYAPDDYSGDWNKPHSQTEDLIHIESFLPGYAKRQVTDQLTSFRACNFRELSDLAQDLLRRTQCPRTDIASLRTNDPWAIARRVGGSRLSSEWGVRCRRYLRLLCSFAVGGGTILAVEGAPPGAVSGKAVATAAGW